MSSSIFTSEPAGWSRALRSYVVACLVLGAAIGGLLIALDPYDTGRFAVFGAVGVPQMGQRLSAASVGRAPDAAAAVFGSSTIQLLDPARLTQLTGLRFVSLAVAGTGPIEQLTVADWFLRHHASVAAPAPKATVFGLDRAWCRSDGWLVISNPFPFWLYSESSFTYAVNMLRLKTVEAAGRKLKLLLGRDSPLRADGYRDYDTGHSWDEEAAEREFATIAAGGAMPDRVEFAAVPLLRRFLGRLPAEAVAMLVFLPRHHSALPPPGSPAERVETMCKTAFRDLAAERARTVLLDFLVDGDLARDDNGFWDQIHYRQPVARVIEHDIADAMPRS